MRRSMYCDTEKRNCRPIFKRIRRFHQKRQVHRFLQWITSGIAFQGGSKTSRFRFPQRNNSCFVGWRTEYFVFLEPGKLNTSCLCFYVLRHQVPLTVKNRRELCVFLACKTEHFKYFLKQSNTVDFATSRNVIVTYCDAQPQNTLRFPMRKKTRHLRLVGVRAVLVFQLANTKYLQCS